MDIWGILKRETPTRVDEINLALQNCIDTIENTRVLLSDKSKKYMDLEKSQEAIELIQVRKKLLDIKSYMEGVKSGDVFIQRTTEETTINAIATPIEEIGIDEEVIDDDTRYLVDQTIPYKLSEDFMNTKPCAFGLQGKKYSVKNFNELLVKFCEVLYQKNKKLFEKIAREHRVKCGENGKVMICFKQDKAADELPKNKCTSILSSNILVFTNINNPTKVYAIKELLSMYHISENSFSVYLKWDKRIDRGQRPIGKLLNIDYDYSQEIVTVIQPKDKPEISVAQLAYDFFKEYFKDTHRYYDIKNFLDEVWCADTFKMACPMLKEYNPNQNLKEQTMWGGKNYPSYAQKYKYQINGKIYLISQRWHEQYRDKLESWINEQDSTYLKKVYSKKKDDMSMEQDNKCEMVDFKQQSLLSNTNRHKKDCIHYDFKKNQCMCTQSDATFTMSCNNVNSCKYFTPFSLHIIPKQYCKKRCCPYCNTTLEKDIIECIYRPTDEKEIHNKLISYKCENCDTNYVADTVYKGYTHSKKLEDLNVTFVNSGLV